MKNREIKPDAEFAKRMRTLMGNRNLKLEDIAAATDNAVSTVSTWRRGRVPRKEHTIRKLAEVFGVSSQYLIFGNPTDDSETIFSNEMLELDSRQQEKMAIIEEINGKIAELVKSSEGIKALRELSAKISGLAKSKTRR